MPIVRRARKSQSETDSKSLQVIMAGQFLASLSAFVFAWIPALQFPAALRVPAFVAGLALLIAGSLLRRHCFRMLGASFTGDVQARPDQKVVTDGAYGFVRHPSYTAGILMNTGVGVALGSWLGGALLAAASAAVYIYRMNVEERALVAAIGDPYREFMSARKRLIPFVY